MNMKPHPLVKLPTEYQVPLYLIKEELKCRKLFRALSKAGLTDCHLQPHLDELILQTLELNHSEEVFNMYNDLMEKRSKKIKDDPNSLMKQAMKVYTELTNKKKNN